MVLIPWSSHVFSKFIISQSWLTIFIALNFLKTQFSQTTNSSTSKQELLHSVHDNLSMKEYVHGLFTTEVEN